MNPIRIAMERLPGKWYQGDLCGPNESYCGLGHVHNVYMEVHGDIIPDDVWELMDNTAKEQYPDRIDESDSKSLFAMFNDHEDTTEDEVLAILEKVAVKVDEHV